MHRRPSTAGLVLAIDDLIDAKVRAIMADAGVAVGVSQADATKCAVFANQKFGELVRAFQDRWPTTRYAPYPPRLRP